MDKPGTKAKPSAGLPCLVTPAESRQAFFDWFDQRSGPAGDKWLSHQVDLMLVWQAGVDWALKQGKR